MSDVDFNSILDMPVEEIKARPPMPIGLFDFRIKSSEPFTSTQKKTPGVRFIVVPFNAVETDLEALAASGGFDREMKLDFYITPDASPRLKEFLVEHCKVEGSTLREMIANSLNQGFRANVISEVSQKGNPYSVIDRTMAIE